MDVHNFKFEDFLLDFNLTEKYPLINIGGGVSKETFVFNSHSIFCGRTKKNNL